MKETMDLYTLTNGKINTNIPRVRYTNGYIDRYIDMNRVDTYKRRPMHRQMQED